MIIIITLRVLSGEKKGTKKNIVVSRFYAILLRSVHAVVLAKLKARVSSVYSMNSLESLIRGVTDTKIMENEFPNTRAIV
jgi:hypothetical protein